MERCLIAVFLLRCLDRAKFFENAEFLMDDANTTIDDVKDYVGGLLLRHLQSVAITAFSINELQVNWVIVLGEGEAPAESYWPMG